MCLRALLYLKRKKWYLGALVVSVIVILPAFGGLLHYNIAYGDNIDKLTDLKSQEKHFRSRNSENGTKFELESAVLAVEELETIQKSIYNMIILCWVIFGISFFLFLSVIACREAIIYFPRFENFLQKSTIKELTPCKKPECCSGSDEDTISQIARDLSASFDRTAQESIVFRGIRNTEGRAGQEASANLPGAPSTSNN